MFALSANGQLPFLYGGPDYQLGTWYHVVGTWDGVTKKLFVNGTMVASAPLPGLAIAYPDSVHPPPATLLTIGQYRDINEHYPLIGEVRSVFIYEQALTAAEIQHRYSEGILSTPCGAVNTVGGAARDNNSDNSTTIAIVVVVLAVVVVAILVAVVVIKKKKGSGANGDSPVSGDKKRTDTFGFKNPTYDQPNENGADATDGYHDVHEGDGYLDVHAD